MYIIYKGGYTIRGNTLIHYVFSACRIYKGGVPMYVIADPDLLKHIMVKDFSHFVDRVPVSVSLFFSLSYLSQPLLF